MTERDVEQIATRQLRVLVETKSYKRHLAQAMKGVKQRSGCNTRIAVVSSP